MTSLLRHLPKSHIHNSTAAKILSKCIPNSTFTTVNRGPLTFQVRSFVSAEESVSGLDDMVCGSQRKYYMLGGKGGVGKTICAASLAVKFANQGQPTIIVSTDPAHSLSDSFDQNLSGGKLVPVQGVDSTLYAIEINPEESGEDIKAVTQRGSAVVKNYLDSMGLGMLADELGFLNFEEQPGLDEALVLSKVMHLLDSEKCTKFKRIVFDTAPTGYTLRLLSLADFVDGFRGKVAKLEEKITSVVSEFESAFGKIEVQQDDDVIDKSEQLKEGMAKVLNIFRDPESTEFVIVTIPTVMSLNESSRLCAFLRKQRISVKRLIVNQMLPSSAATDSKFCATRRKDQMRALDLIGKDPELAKLRLIQSPLMDVEIRGVPALKFMGDMLWT